MSCPAFSCPPSDPTFYQDPYPAYDQIRSLGPLVHWTDYHMPVTAHHHCIAAILRDKRFGRDVSHVASPQQLGWPDAPPHLKPFYDAEKSSMLEREPPVHTRLRGLVNRAFVSRAVEGLRPRIALLCHELIDGFAADAETELLARYATPIPVIVIAELLGLPPSDAPLLLDWSHRMVAMYQFNRTRSVEDSAVAATLSFSDYLRGHIANRRKAKSDDLISSLIVARDQGDRLSEDELVTTIILLMNAGHEATVHALGNALKLILVMDQSDSALGSDLRSLLPTQDGCAAIVEEALRFDPPLHLFTRYALENFQLFGQDFSIGDKVGLLLAAGNRDASAFQNPNTFNPRRFLGGTMTPTPLSFGAGIHFCVGAPLARMELQIALPILFARLPDLRFLAQPSFRDSYHFHGLTRLDVTWRH